MIQRYRLASPSTFNQVLTWNSASQLMQVVTTRNGTTTTLQFAYDGNGRRLRTLVDGWNDTHYIWDGDQLVAETDAAGNTVRLYTYFPGTDQLNSVVAGGQTYPAARDAAGNVIGMIDRNSLTAKDKYSYQPFGTMDQNDQNVPNSMRWKGLLYDAESGLYYVRARYYAPEMRRFLSEDPIGLAGGINQYRFAGNDPVNGSDPSGLCGWTATNWSGADVTGWDYEWCPGGPPEGVGTGLINGQQVPSWDPAPYHPEHPGGTSATVLQKVLTAAKTECAAKLAGVGLDLLAGGLMVVSLGEVQGAYVAAKAGTAVFDNALRYMAINGGRKARRRLISAGSKLISSAMENGTYLAVIGTTTEYKLGVLEEWFRGGGVKSLIPFASLFDSGPEAWKACHE